MHDQLVGERVGRGEHTRNRKPKGIREFSKEPLQQSRLSSSRWSRYYHRTKLLHCIWSIGMFVVVLRGGCFAISSGKKSYQRWLPLSRLGSKKTEIGVCSREKLRGNQADNSSKKKKKKKHNGPPEPRNRSYRGRPGDRS